MDAATLVRSSEIAAAAPGEKPEHPFTNFQWYFTAGRNTVYFAAFSPVRIDPDAFRVFVGHLLDLAPQLNLASDDRRQVHIDLTPVRPDDVASYYEIESFDGFPDKVLGPRTDLFENAGLPAFRAECYVLKDGARADGNRSFVLMRAPHALMEGVDTSRLMRGLSAGHVLPTGQIKAPFKRAAATALGIGFVPINYAVTALLDRTKNPWSIGTLVLDRGGVKRAAAKLGVQQRSLIFALVMRGFYDPQGASSKKQTIGYTNLPSRRSEGDDSYVRLQMRTTKVRHERDFAAYARQMDDALRADAGDTSWAQLQNDAFFRIHRRIARRLPFLYRRRFFGYVPYDFLISLLPPHLSGSGLFEDFKFNDVYCGSHTPGVNCCVIVPQKDRFSLNIYCPARDLERISDIGALASATAGSSLLLAEG